MDKFWKRWVESPESADLDDARRDVILEVGVGVFVIGWLIALIAYGGKIDYLWSAVLLVVGAWATERPGARTQTVPWPRRRPQAPLRPATPPCPGCLRGRE